jgi:SAM-dependent methyltransferase
MSESTPLNSDDLTSYVEGKVSMNEYTTMAHYYDTLMTSGYYDYDAIAASLERHIGAHDRVLEIGVGTGLAAEQLHHRQPHCHLTGVDHTEAMLAIAQGRVGEWCTLVHADVSSMALEQTFDVIYSCGGVWSLVDTGMERQFCTHIPDEDQDCAAFHNMVGHLRPGGLLLLSVQGEHQDYEKALPGGVLYRQRICWRGTLLDKEYAFEGPQGSVVQRNTFRVRQQPEMEAFLRQHGLVALPEATDGGSPHFHAFRKNPVAASVRSHP